ncbi:thiamine-phosphate pyrophosphorylase [Loktanella sp. DSM 29012]|uniref:thiamine phosphate synthase n=1 Tax=Loktanella sp. DSM 29012 TaxID=1881056 RepID=UPI0008B902CC|nr:thiamine phosphate synthase [Loktanella sp. DSM 29012]SEQ07175.1 thiamine-phosphate pyrophosphorylase [Loktanella sp. DSM 29012]
MALIRAQLRLYLVTDPLLCARMGLIETVTAAVQGGVTCVQLRDKSATTHARIDAARAVKSALAGSGVPLIINDDLDAAVAAGVDGVHLGQGDAQAATARARLGPEAIIGLSCESPQDVRAADMATVDYLGLGTVFPTATKDDHKPSIGLDGLATLAGLTDPPCVAIGGLKHAHAGAVLAAGCDGIAVVSAICGQPDPETAARTLMRAMTPTTGEKT